MLVTKEEIYSDSRVREIVMARMLVVYVFSYLGFSQTRTGLIINRDHSTVKYYIKKTIENKDYLFRDYLNGLSLFLSEKGLYLPNIEEFTTKINLRYGRFKQRRTGKVKRVVVFENV